MKELFLSAEEQALINVTELCLISSGVSDERRRCTGELLQHCLYLAAKE